MPHFACQGCGEYIFLYKSETHFKRLVLDRVARGEGIFGLIGSGLVSVNAPEDSLEFVFHACKEE